MDTYEMIASFQAIIALAQNGLSASTTAEQRDEQLRLIAAEASRSATRLLSAIVLG
jgi:hypothetical protein